jgi:hypothetical protein
MGVIRFRAQLQRRGPAAAVVLDETQVEVPLLSTGAFMPTWARR